MEPESSLPSSENPATQVIPNLGHTNPVHTLQPYSKYILILSSHVRLGNPNDLLPSDLLIVSKGARCRAPHTVPNKSKWTCFSIQWLYKTPSPFRLNMLPVNYLVEWPNFIGTNTTKFPRFA
jgi:hypothetical protein